MKNRNRVLFGGCAFAVLAQASMAAADQGVVAAAVAPASPAEVSDAEIIVTGSRIASTGFTAPTPTTVIGEELIEARGITNVIDAINEVPAFRPSQTPAAAARGGTSSGGSFVDLRGLSAVGGAPTARTLVLVDGRRFVPSNQIGQVDLNLIPTSLIRRTEVVTGGASAAWGSDAVAGVVNLLLKDKLEGFEGSIAYGQSDESDYKEYSLSLAAGTGFAGERGHIIAGIDYVNNKGVPDAFTSRDWGREAYGNLALSARPAGTPSRNILPDVRISDRMAPGGVIVGGPLDNIEFLPGGITRTFTPGTLVGGNQMLGGGANNSNDGIYFAAGSNLVNPIERYAAFARLTYEAFHGVEFFVEGSRAESKFSGYSASHRDDANLTIRVDNAFLPESVRTQMQTLGLQSITVGRIAYDDNFGFYKLRTDQEVDRIAFGAKGELSERWSWDAYYQWGRSNYVQKNEGTEMANYRAAIDAVFDGSGNIVCRPGAAGSPDAGCVPFNIFGQNSPSDQAVDYVRKIMTNDVTTKQQVAAINVAGDAFDLWAGPVSVAFGAEYRKEKVHSTVNADSQARRFDYGNYQAISGNYDTKELYFETVVPLARETAFAKSLELNGAIRLTDYSTSGTVTTWKIGGSYEPFADLRFRVTQSRDIRAPNLNELFAGAVVGRGLVVDPVLGTSYQVNSIVSGNLDLDPERADTFTGGMVYQPEWLPGFRASVDYYNIKIKDVITQLTAQNIVDQCEDGDLDLCALIIRNAGGTITEVRGQSLNFNSLKTEGVDVELSYALPQDTLIPGSVTLRALGTYVDKLVLTGVTGPIDRVRQLVPKWTWNASVHYSYGRFGAMAQLRYLGSTLFDSTLVGPDDPDYDPANSDSLNLNRRSPVAYVNLSAQYDIVQDGDRSLQLFGVVNNVFDKDPPPMGGYNPVGGVLYDLIGRAYRVGLRFKF